MRIAIVGAGGVGGYFGGRLAAAGEDIHFVARGEHLAALRSNGLMIRGLQGDIHVPKVNATDDARSIGPVDLVLFCVKLYDMQSAAASALPPLIGPSTIVVPTQNGVDAVSTLSEAVGADHVVGGTTWLSAVIEAPGVIRHVALGRLAFGSINGAHPAVLREFRDTCAKAGVDAKLSDRILIDIWAKFARLTVFSGITCIARSPIGVCLESPGLYKLLDAAVHESVSVARGMQISLPHSAYEDTLTGLRALPPHAKASMLEDLERGRRLELPWLSGAMARIGGEVGVETPTHDLFVTLLSPHVNGHPPKR